MIYWTKSLRREDGVDNPCNEIWLQTDRQTPLKNRFPYYHFRQVCQFGIGVNNSICLIYFSELNLKLNMHCLKTFMGMQAFLSRNQGFFWKSGDFKTNRNMPPAKKRKTGVNNKETVSAPSSMAEVPKCCLLLRDWINDLYTCRHGSTEEKAWPVGHGGSFQEIVQRCFDETDRLLGDSVNFAKTIGLIGRDADINVFAQKFLIFKDPF